MQSLEVSSAGGTVRVSGLSLTGGSFAWWGYVGDTAEDPGLASDMLEVTPVQGGLELSCTENWSLRARYCVLGGVLGGRVVSLLKVIQRGATLSYPRSVVVGSASGSVAYVTFSTSCTVLGNVSVRMASGTSYTLGSVEAYGGGYRFSATSQSANESFTTGNYGTIEVMIGSGTSSLSFTVSVYQAASVISEYSSFGGSTIQLAWGDSISGQTSGSGFSVSYGSAYASEVRLSPYSGAQGSSTWYSWYDVVFKDVFVTVSYTSGQSSTVLLSTLGSDYEVSLTGIQITGGRSYRILSSSYSGGEVSLRVGFPWLGGTPTSAWSGVLSVDISLSRGGVLLSTGTLSYNGFACAANERVVSDSSDVGVSPSPYSLGWESGASGEAILLGYTQTTRWTSGFVTTSQVSDYDVTVTPGSQASSLYSVDTRLIEGSDRRVSVSALTSNQSPWAVQYSGSEYGCTVKSASGVTEPVSLSIIQSGRGWNSQGGAFYFNGVPADEREKYDKIWGILYLTSDASAQYNGGTALPSDAKAVPGLLLCSWDRSSLVAVPSGATLVYPDTVGFDFTDTCYMLWAFELRSSTVSGTRWYQGPAGVRFQYNAAGSTLSTAIALESYY